MSAVAPVQVFHLQGQHNQKDHGRRAGGTNPNLDSNGIPHVDVLDGIYNGEATTMHGDIVSWTADVYPSKITGYTAVHGKIYANDSLGREENVGSFIRTFWEDGEVLNDSLKIDPTFQGQGIGTTFLDATERQLANIGVESLTVDAVAVGRYAWAARGYKAEWDTVGDGGPADTWLRLADVQASTFPDAQADEFRGKLSAVRKHWADTGEIYGADLLAINPAFKAVFLEGPTWTGTRNITHLRTDDEDLAVQVFHLQGQHNQKDHGNRGGGSWHDGWRGSEIRLGDRPDAYYNDYSSGEDWRYARDRHDISLTDPPKESFRLAKPPTVEITRTDTKGGLFRGGMTTWTTGDGKVRITAETEDFEWGIEANAADGYGPPDPFNPDSGSGDPEGFIQMLAGHAEMGRRAAGLDEVDIWLGHHPSNDGISGWVNTDNPDLINLAFSTRQQSPREKLDLSPSQSDTVMAASMFTDDYGYTVIHEMQHVRQLKEGRLTWEATNRPHDAPPDSFSVYESGREPLMMSEYGRTAWWESEAEAFAEWVVTGGTTTNPIVQEYATRLDWDRQRTDVPLAAAAGDRPFTIVEGFDRPGIETADGIVRWLDRPDQTEVFRFNPNQPRDERGRWTDTGAAPMDPTAAKDALEAGEPVTVAASDAARIVERIGAENTGVVDLTNLTVAEHPYLFSGVPSDGRRSRADMPQVPEHQIDNFKAHLEEQGVKFTRELGDATLLKATQTELDATKVGQMITKVRAGKWATGHPLWVANDDHILDGHHRWATQALLSIEGYDMPFDMMRVDMTIDDLLAAADEFNEEHDVTRKSIAMAVPDILVFGYDPSQPRDDHGRWTSTGGGDAAWEAKWGNERRSGDGDCYNTAWAVIDAVPADEQDRYRVVHGVPLGQGDIEGIRFDHAWVERKDDLPAGAADRFSPEQLDQMQDLMWTVIDKSNGNDVELPRAVYYSIGNIDGAEVRRYTWTEAATNMVSSGHFGPWDDDDD